MGSKSHKSSSSSSGHTNCASCIVATIFLIFIAIILLVLFFTLFKPKDPKLSVNAIQLPTFSLTNGTTINFTFSQYVTVKNPNRAVLTHYDSSLQLIYSGSQVGFMFIPAGKIDSGRTKYMTLSFSVDSFPLLMNGPPGFGIGDNGGGIVSRVGPPVIEFQSRLKMGGRVSVLHFFTHHVEASAWCSVAISVNDGSVLGFHC